MDKGAKQNKPLAKEDGNENVMKESGRAQQRRCVKRVEWNMEPISFYTA